MRDFSELNINEGGRRIERDAPSSEVICAFQDHFGIILPDEYLKMLRHSNGGHPELDSIKPINRPEAARWAVDHFYFLDNDKTSCESLWAAMKEWRRVLGEGSLPFAEDGGGNQFLFDLRASTAAVKVCVHDENFAILDIAPSFEAFIDGLWVDPEYL
jgi:hypothetical protein